MNPALATPIGFAVMAVAAALAGALSLALRPDWSRAHAGLVSLVSAGLLISFTLLNILPEALHAAPDAAGFVLAGYLVGLSASVLGHRHVSAQAAVDAGAPVLIPLAGIGLHAFLDGVIYTVTAAGDAGAGLMAAGALSLHKVPVAALTLGLLLQAGLRTLPAFALTLLAVGAMTPVGQASAEPLLALAGPEGLSHLFAVSAGLLLFVATGPLLAHGADVPRPRALLALGAGVALALLMSQFLPHEHGGLPHAHSEAPPPFR